MSLWTHLKSFAAISVITLDLLVWCGPLVLLALLKMIFPPARAPVDRVMDGIYRVAVVIDDFWLNRVVGVSWPRPDLGLRKDENLIVVSNHASWSDILIIQSLIVRRGPIMKFLSKRELIFVPIFGLIFWAFDFPILRRRAASGEDEAARRAADLAAVSDACRAVRNRPAGLLSFVEGTRFTEAKRRADDSPYSFLLRPRAGGFSALMDGLEGTADRVIDLTLIYPEEVSFWAFLSGQCPRVGVDAVSIPVGEIPSDLLGRKAWLAERWARKDALIAAARGGSTAQTVDAGECGGSS